MNIGTRLQLDFSAQAKPQLMAIPMIETHGVAYPRFNLGSINAASNRLLVLEMIHLRVELLYRITRVAGRLEHLLKPMYPDRLLAGVLPLLHMVSGKAGGVCAGRVPRQKNTQQAALRQTSPHESRKGSHPVSGGVSSGVPQVVTD